MDVYLWNTIYIQLVLDTLRSEGHLIKSNDVKRLSILKSRHVNVLGHYSFSLPELVADGQLRPLNDWNEIEVEFP